MAKMKIFELKKEINDQVKNGIESKDILDYLEKSFGVKKTHSSNLEDNEVQVIKNHFVQAERARAAQGQPVAKPAAPAAQHTAQRPQPTQTHTAQQGTSSGHATPVQPAQVHAAQVSAAKPALNQQGAVRQSQQGVNQAQTHAASQAHASQTQTHTSQTHASQAQTHASQVSGQRPSGGQNGMRQGQQGYQGQASSGQHGAQGQGYQGSQNTARQGEGQRPSGQPMQSYSAGGQRSSGYGQQGSQSQGQSQQSGQRQPRPQGDSRPSDQMQRQPRPQGEGMQGQGNSQYAQRQQRPAGTGYQGNRSQDGRGQDGRYQGDRPQRPAGEGYQGNRPYGDRPQRPAGEGGYQGNRPYGDRPQRPAGEGGYQGNRPYGDRPQRPAGEGGYQGNRPYGDRPQRPAGEGGYQGNRPYGDRPQRPAGEGGYQGNRPYGDRPQRPQGEGYQGQGSRPPYAGGGQQGRGNYGGNSGGYSRPAGQRPGGFGGGRGFEEAGKDDDDKPNYGNRSQARKPAGQRGGGERKNFDQQILDQKVAEKNDNSNKRNRDRINKEKSYKDRILERDHNGDEVKAKIAPKKGQFIQPKPIQVVEEEIKVISIPEILTIKELAEKMKKPSAALIKKLFLAGKIVTLNQEITYEEAEEIALEYDIIAEKEVKVNEVEELLKEEDEDPATMEKRPPVVCVMGHVDHGKTSLLDAIRETNVTSREAGGITQHIGASVIEINGEKITFLDTPGHEAFTAMRMRGAKSTDIAILVVAADDGVMPQTIEAINHAKAAGVQIIVAINKIDKPSANIERVKQELTEYELIAEDWGGDTIFVPVSAHTKEGIQHLLEMILLTAEMVELKANPNRNARGIVIEAELDKGRGPVATILVQKGTLRVGDNVAVGASFGKVRAMNDDLGRRVKEATPSTPVEVLGLNEVPDAGEILVATTSEKEARAIADAYLVQGKERLLADTKAKLSLDGLFSQIKAGNIKDLNLIVKADVQGSVEAMKQSLLKLSNNEVAVRIVHFGVGAINESDVILASTSNAIIIGFNVKPDNAAKETADREKVDVKLYRVIYNAINDVEAAMKGMLDPIFEERIIGHAEIRMTFKASGVGTIAGSYVLDGKVIRGSKARIYRDNTLIYEGLLASLKRFQDDVKEVATGYECGLVFEKFNDVKEGDKVELYIMAEVPR